ncbi:MAG: efflux RND transporter periplasmic adaptor subunit [Pseudomonadota bacterium]
MCKQCHRARRRRVAVLALTPALLVGQPVANDLRLLFAKDADPSASFVLQLGDAAHATEAKASTDRGNVKYTCPMHPHYIADAMGACPICGMDLVKLDTGSDPSPASSESRTVITVAAETIQNMGVRLGKAELSSFGRGVRSYGIVHENERQQTEITSRVEGWIEDLQITAVGDQVKKGDLLFKLYSPQLIVSQGDFQRSRGTRDLAGRGEGQLRAFGLQNRAIKEIKKRKRPLEFVPFYAEQDGTVSQLMLRKGTYVKRGMMLAKIQDYSTVWLRVGVAEMDLGFITKDTPAIVTFPNLPGRQVRATVDYVYPTIDTNTRTGQVRLVIPNEDGLLKPGSYADVTFEINAQRRLAVPSESVLRSGAGRYVVVSLGQGRFEPRLVEAGLIADGRTEIKKGVLAGEEIVVSGQFLLDSESALRESFRKLQKLQVPLSLLKLTKTEFAMVDHLIDASLYIHEALADGYDVTPQQLDPAISIKDLLWPRYKDTQLAFVLTDATRGLKALQKARTESELQKGLSLLNNMLRSWVLTGATEHYRSKNLAVFEDPKSNRIWFQVGKKPINPYARGGGKLIPFPKTKTETQSAAVTGSGANDGN